MSQSVTEKSRAKRFTPLGIVFAVLGVILFAYFVKKTGVAQIIEGIKRLGAGFLLILAVSTIRPLVRAKAWTWSFEAPYRLPFRDALSAYVTGDALGTLMPLGIIVSEPAKAALVRERVPLMAGLSAIAIENLFYSLSVALFIFSGTAALLLSFPLPKPLWYASTCALVGVVIILFIAYLFIRQQWKFASGLLEHLYVRGIGRHILETKRGRVSAIEDRVYGFYERNRARFLPILLLEAGFHLAGVVEIYITLYFISDTRPTLLAAFILESVNRVINVVFKFVPLRVGVDEAGTGLITKVLQLGTTSGVTLAIIRKARVICWAALGVALLVRRGLSVRAVAEEAEATIARETTQEKREEGPTSTVIAGGKSR